MCGRIAHFRSEEKYLKWLKSQIPVAGPVSKEPAGRYNVAPQTPVGVLHLEDGNLRFRDLRWGYAPGWAGDRPPSINARLDKAVSSRYWADIWPHGRCLVPADGWYEWVGDSAGRARQPWFIHLTADEPMFLAGIARLPSMDLPADPSEGFAILTTEGEGGLLDVHDRMPVVLPPQIAREWLAPGMSSERALDLVRQHGLSAEAFSWHAVSTAVGNVRNQGRHLIEPVAPAPRTLDLFDEG